MINIDIETDKYESLTSKAGKPYYIQQAYAHTIERNGNPKRYPEQMRIILPKDDNGRPLPYAMGTYKLADHCIQVRNGSLEIGFPELVKVKK